MDIGILLDQLSVIDYALYHSSFPIVKSACSLVAESFGRAYQIAFMLRSQAAREVH